jgi:hypothetical protein
LHNEAWKVINERVSKAAIRVGGKTMEQVRNNEEEVWAEGLLFSWLKILPF